MRLNCRLPALLCGGCDALLQALDKITTSPGGAADEVVLERGQQEWHERYSRAFDDLERMQSSLKRQQQNQQQHQQQYYLQQNRQDQEQQQLINEHSEHMLAAIQNKLAGDALPSASISSFVLVVHRSCARHDCRTLNP